jgi:hypothetical protein
VSHVKYGMGSYIPNDGIINTHSSGNLKCYIAKHTFATDSNLVTGQNCLDRRTVFNDNEYRRPAVGAKRGRLMDEWLDTFL